MHDIFLLSRGKNHVLKKHRVRRGSTVPGQLTWPSTKKSDGTENFLMAGSVDGCSVLLETQLDRKSINVDTTQALSVGGFLPPMVAAGERPEFDIKLPLWNPLQILPGGYLLGPSTRGHYCKTTAF